MIGVVLAAGLGRRLAPHAQGLPKALLPIGQGVAIFDVILGNLAAVGIERLAVVVSDAAPYFADRVPDARQRHGIAMELIQNRRPEWNNAYSLWLARHAFAEGAIIVNGDTLHPVEVERALLARSDDALVLAVDSARPTDAEAMKVTLRPDRYVDRISKQLPPTSAYGEYIGVSLVRRAGARALADALEATWRNDPDEYYEGAYQRLADQGLPIGVADPGNFDWVEVDDGVDLAVARELACRF
ncbi:NTP transferase domain-containing protein [Planosporangium sp. 12N6]|uniref:phosphocholine cytidylyltransferase family protein n=1 Tax=Planosporangium spinosum TaxID=3402278 RepID=UPI003CFBA900